jgi:phage major head subunit gpT-like protein
MSDLQVLSSRAIRGMYFEALAASAGIGWVDAVSNYFPSDQASEQYPWIGMPPALREWVGGRQLVSLKDFDGPTIKNLHYEASFPVQLKDLRRDKTGQIEARMREFIQRGQSHFGKLLSTLIVAGESTVCYDGQYYFDTDHSEGSSGTQDNDITTTIAGLPVETHGVVTAPSKEEMLLAMVKSISQFFIFKDDQGEPINEDAKAFHVQVPVGLWPAASSALSKTNVQGPGIFNVDGFSIELSVNPRLTSGGWTDKFVTFRTDGSVKPLIRQEETPPVPDMLDEASDHCKVNKEIVMLIDTWRNVGYGRWQGAVLNKLV